MNDESQSTTTLREYDVWDRTTRWFHWINVLCVLTLAALGLFILNGNAFGVSNEGKVALKELHVYVGYVFALNVGWRLIWAFVGSKSARWRSILPGGRGYGARLGAYLRGIRAGSTATYLGHNPVGRLMVTLLLLLMTMQAVTGLVLAGTDVYKPPFGGFIAEWVTAGDPEKLAQLKPGSRDFVDEASYEAMRDFRKPFAETHVYVFYGLLIAVFLHVLGVVLGEVRERSGLVSAMFTGRKVLSDAPVDGEDD